MVCVFRKGQGPTLVYFSLCPCASISSKFTLLNILHHIYNLHFLVVMGVLVASLYFEHYTYHKLKAGNL